MRVSSSFSINTSDISSINSTSSISTSCYSHSSNDSQEIKFLDLNIPNVKKIEFIKNRIELLGDKQKKVSFLLLFKQNDGFPQFRPICPHTHVSKLNFIIEYGNP